MAATPRPVTEIQIGGNTYRVQSSADSNELAHLVAVVEARFGELPNNQRHESRRLVLVALSLAHDLEQLRREHASLRASVVERLTTLIDRVDTALDHRDENGELLPPIPTADSTADSLGLEPAVAPTTTVDASDAESATEQLVAGLPSNAKVDAPRRERSSPTSREANESR
jgi:cell division protein ZapA (FtsZ GTPase activity inhibitor)